MESLSEAIRSLKIGSLYSSIAIALAIMLEILYYFNPNFIQTPWFLIISTLAYFILLFGITRIGRAFLELKADIGSNGIQILILGLLSLLFSVFFSPFFYLGIALVAIGNALIGTAIYHLGKYYKVKSVWIAGILIGVSVASLPGYLLIYFNSDKIIQEATKIPQKPTIEIKVSDKKIGYGILKSNGVAEFKIDYDKVAEIISAKLQGYEFQLLEISPKTVKPGENQIKAKFNLTAPLVPGNIYNVELYLSNGEKLLASLVFQM